MSSNDPPIRVLVVDDHPTVRDMIRIGCQDQRDLEIVGEAQDGREAVTASRSLHPDVLVLDLILPHLDGFEVVRRVRQDDPKVRVLILTNRDDPVAALESIRLGVHGFLEKTAPLEAIIEAIRTVGQGGEVFSEHHERLARSRIGDLARQARTEATAMSRFSPRELDVMRFIADGLTSGQAASRLGLSKKTVETHISSLYRKLGVKGRIQAVQRAAALGLVNLSERPPPAQHAAGRRRGSSISTEGC